MLIRKFNNLLYMTEIEITLDKVYVRFLPPSGLNSEMLERQL